VLVTYEYMSLHSDDYQQQLRQTMRPTVTADRPFSFRNELSDQWYDLHNPDQTTSPMIVQFRTSTQDFPANIDRLTIQQLVLYFVRKSGSNFEVPVTYLRFNEDENPGQVGGSASSSEGIISTRRGNAGSWMVIVGKKPFGVWELALPNS